MFRDYLYNLKNNKPSYFGVIDDDERMFQFHENNTYDNECGH